MPNEPFYSSLSAQEIENILVGVNDSSGLLLRNALGQIRGAVGGQDYEVPPVIQAADPTASTVGVVGQLLINTTRHSLFVCSYAYGGRYTWTPVRINNLTPEEIASIVSLESAGAEYQVSRSGSAPPEGEWSTSIPAVSPGFYLWTRVSIKFSGADPIVYYSVSRQGIDGSGAVSKVAGISPGPDGNVQLTADAIGALASGSNIISADMLQSGSVAYGKLAPGSVNLLFADVSVPAGSANWTEDTGTDWAAEYPYRCDLPLVGVTESYIPECIFAYPQASGGKLFSTVQSFNGGVRIWASEVPVEAFVIPQIEARRVKA